MVDVYSIERGEVTVDSSMLEEGKDMVDGSSMEREEYMVDGCSMERGEEKVLLTLNILMGNAKKVDWSGLLSRRSMKDRVKPNPIQNNSSVPYDSGLSTWGGG